MRESKPKRILGSVELRELLIATEPRFGLALRFIAETGVRLSELLGLAWGDVDLDAAMIEITHQLDATTRTRVTLKTARSRRPVAITEQLGSELRDIRPDRVTKHQFVFCELDGRPYSQKQIERAIRRAAELAGLGDEMSGAIVIEHAPTPHDLRHSHASALIADGWDVESVSRRLGHSNSAITLQTYTYEFETAQRRDEQRRSLTTLYGSVMEASQRSTAQQTGSAPLAEVTDLQAKRNRAQ